MMQSRFFFHTLKDWAAIGRLTGLAGVDQTLERAVKSAQVSDLGFHLLQLGLRLPLHIAAPGCRTNPET